MEAYYLKKLEDGLSPNTIHKHHALIHTALKKALKLEYVQKNVAELADTPKRAKKNTPAPYNEAELIQLLNVFREDVLFYVVTFAVLFGLRRSEILGLRWDRIDLTKGILQIDTTALRCMENGFSKRSIPRNTLILFFWMKRVFFYSPIMSRTISKECCRKTICVKFVFTICVTAVRHFFCIPISI